MRPATVTLGDRTFTFRRAEEQDVAALAALLADDAIGAGREDASDLAPYLRAFHAVDGDPRHLLVVAEDHHAAIAATLQLSLLPGLSRRGALRAQIEGVRVAAAFRGAALGSTLVRWAVNEARARGAGLVQLTTDLRRDDARRFYERLGFVGSHLGMKVDLRADPSVS
ncbi:GNAT family N-acetyltransferase [uncultured Amnibacterium sp.]|uniref:GNAT family N-acetyltransferase n=1 Tax=uncultured Amnibacterium sp. TaxID=1631851 RepID=UPI0035C9CBE0